MELLGERWTILILRELIFGPRRFSDLRAELPGISAKVLTERLGGMEANGILQRLTLTEPAPVQLFQLTAWGLAAEPIIQAIGRWAAASPLHDTTLPLSAASFMMSLRTMLDHRAAQGQAIRSAFRIGAASFSARLHDADLAVRRGPTDNPDLVFTATQASQLAAVFYAGIDPAPAGVAVEGDPQQLRDFLDLFNLPQKISLPT